jgi:hypothetical protein
MMDKTWSISQITSLKTGETCFVISRNPAQDRQYNSRYATPLLVKNTNHGEVTFRILCYIYTFFILHIVN